jgi:hypothetical protein
MNVLDQLAEALAALYGSDPTSRWMLQRAGLEFERVPPDADPVVHWRRVTVGAVLTGRLSALLSSALHDHPNDPALLGVVERLNAASAKRRRRRALVFSGLVVLVAGVTGLLVYAPTAGQVRGKVLGLSVEQLMVAEVALEGCIRPEPLAASGAFTLACPSLDATRPLTLSLSTPDRDVTVTVPAERVAGGEILAACGIESSRLTPPAVRSR